MGLVEAIHPALGTIDYRQPMVKLVFIGGSFLFCSAVFLVGALGSNVLKSYQNLSSTNKVIWNLGFTRGLFGVFGTVVGLWAIWWDEISNQDVVNAVTPTGFVVSYVSTGYFMFDALAILANDLMITGHFDILANVHHFLSFAGYFYVAYYEFCNYFSLASLSIEVIAPLGSINYWLVKCGLADSLIWKINRLALIHAFLLRSAAECFLWVQVYLNWNSLWVNIPFLQLAMYLVFLGTSTFILTPSWGYIASVRFFNSCKRTGPSKEEGSQIQNDAVSLKKET